jgi:hypothetical protein
MTEHNLPEPDDAPWLNLTQEEINQLRYNKQELTDYGRERIRKLMKETDISKVLIEGDYATIMGVKYKRVAPATLYEVFANFGYSVDMCNAVVNAVEEWLPNEMEHDEDLYRYIAGWNDCIDTVRGGLR